MRTASFTKPRRRVETVARCAIPPNSPVGLDPFDAGQFDSQPAVRAVRQREVPAVRARDVVYDGEPEPGPVLAGRESVVQHRLLALVGDPGTVVLDAESGRSSPRFRRSGIVVETADAHRHVAAGVLHRVPEQVLQQGEEPIPVGVDGAVALQRERGVGRVDVSRRLGRGLSHDSEASIATAS